MSQTLELLKKARKEHNPSLLTEGIPYARWMGIEIKEENGCIRAALRFKESHIGNPTLPALHGGTLGALLESTGIFALLWSTETPSVPKTINITLDYLRSARPLDTFAEADIVKQGRRVASVRVAAWQTDKNAPVAAASAHFLL